MKKLLLVIAWLLFSLIAPACTITPHATYDDIETAAMAPDATDKDRERLVIFERNIIKASDHFQNKDNCLRSKTLVWFCSRGPDSRPPRKGTNWTAAQMVRAYKFERDSQCGCATYQDLQDWMRNSGL